MFYGIRDRLESLSNMTGSFSTLDEVVSKSIKVDLEKMYDQTAEQLDFLINKYKL